MCDHTSVHFVVKSVAPSSASRKDCADGGVIPLVEKCLAHAEVGQGIRAVLLERALILLHGIVVAAQLGERFAARDDSAHAQPLARFQNVVVRVEDNAVGFRPPERLHRERRFFSGNR